MRPRRVPTTNMVFQLPGGNEDNDLFTEMAQTEDGQPVIISVWELTDYERKAIAEGATIELTVWGEKHQPVALGIGESIEGRNNGS